MESTRLTTFSFDGKAGTLAKLTPILSSATIMPLYRFTVRKWQENSALVIENIVNSLGADNLIVRSSCRNEDRSGQSGAGAYDSIANVNSEPELYSAISHVIASYNGAIAEDEVLVQQMAQDVLACGVAMTRDPESGLPYYVINYTTDGQTDGVTSGSENVLSWIALKDEVANEPPVLKGMIALLQEVQLITTQTALDIEFAITKEGPVLFQVRPMTALDTLGSDHEFLKLIRKEAESLKEACDRLQAGHPEKIALFGIMPDWNPAEIIGVKPRTLAFDLYKYLITDLNWASARFRYGYRDMRGHKLMSSFAGTPYIAIPYSIESFIPASMPHDIVSSVVNASCHHLAQHPDLHDKIEFAIVPTCFTPSLTLKSASSQPALKNLSKAEISLYLDELLKLTEHIISDNGPFANDLRLLPRMEQNLNELKEKELRDTDPLQHFRIALSNASVIGEIFAGSARAAFIATSILKSLEQESVVPQGYTDNFLSRARTVGQELSDDFCLLDKQLFLRKHGHIRPGTYDIRVARYDENPDSYFDWLSPPARPVRTVENTSDSRDLLLSIQKAFHHCGMDIHVKQFFTFALNAVEAREKVKYLYGAFVSEALSALTAWGALHRIDRDTLSHSPLNYFINEKYCDIDSIDAVAKENKRIWQSKNSLRSPSIIDSANALYAHEINVAKPNFITKERAEASVRVLKAGNTHSEDIEGTIVLIENADPGFDWIFTRRISGFITAYGGENSHMSIRAREFGIPAVIGIGERALNRLAGAQRLLMDCAANRVEILS
ncbi:hypothetical protein EFS38_12975 [Dickeya undicola]|uniref:Phosphoenolpyruvate synthase n=2 Tax=Dickeya TaxID=204037 RepID=A0ABX9WT53_9GAMM|nr:PEP-utilizing enzyme [Dickeya undicola]RNM23357.1 hypothetical protein EFS38_12975 [Dickeya undicola]